MRWKYQEVGPTDKTFSLGTSEDLAGKSASSPCGVGALGKTQNAIEKHV